MLVHTKNTTTSAPIHVFSMCFTIATSIQHLDTSKVSCYGRTNNIMIFCKRLLNMDFFQWKSSVGDTPRSVNNLSLRM